ncbi:hypothetical protein [Marinicella litoralis]|uniref:Uncharacterized protein n=1 Tax=Marinicella litoralis TaxID=644220 RepID=A0A4R6XN69_9GAMM|nr:hypothetical protein [Marinicella litoralis]TDR19580.1 hypothetical protein C8D91_2137 [Marinicella litoralis]
MKTSNTMKKHFSESEGTGISNTIQSNRHSFRSESEGTGIKTTLILMCLLISSTSFGSSLYLFSDDKDDNTYQGVLHDTATNTVQQIEGFVENGVYSGINNTQHISKSSDDGTGRKSSDDGTGGLPIPLPETILTVILDCDSTAYATGTVESEEATITIEFETIYLDGELMSCDSSALITMD